MTAPHALAGGFTSVLEQHGCHVEPNRMMANHSIVHHPLAVAMPVPPTAEWIASSNAEHPHQKLKELVVVWVMAVEEA